MTVMGLRRLQQRQEREGERQGAKRVSGWNAQHMKRAVGQNAECRTQQEIFDAQHVETVAEAEMR